LQNVSGCGDSANSRHNTLAFSSLGVFHNASFSCLKGAAVVAARKVLAATGDKKDWDLCILWQRDCVHSGQLDGWCTHTSV